MRDKEASTDVCNHDSATVDLWLWPLLQPLLWHSHCCTCLSLPPWPLSHTHTDVCCVCGLPHPTPLCVHLTNSPSLPLSLSQILLLYCLTRFYVVENGTAMVVERWGRFHRCCYGGWYFLMPFADKPRIITWRYTQLRGVRSVRRSSSSSSLSHRVNASQLTPPFPPFSHLLLTFRLFTKRASTASTCARTCWTFPAKRSSHETMSRSPCTPCSCTASSTHVESATR